MCMYLWYCFKNILLLKSGIFSEPKLFYLNIFTNSKKANQQTRKLKRYNERNVKLVYFFDSDAL